MESNKCEHCLFLHNNFSDNVIQGIVGFVPSSQCLLPSGGYGY